MMSVKPSPKNLQDNNMLPKRKNSLRLKNWDYRLPGPYFVTICTSNRRGGFIRPNLFGQDFIRNSIIEIIKGVGADLSARIHCMVIAIDHIHILLSLTDGNISSLFKVIAIIKVRITQYFNRVGKPDRAGKPAPTTTKTWQRSYYEHIIRDEKDFFRKARYIENHPLKETGNEYAEWH